MDVSIVVPTHERPELLERCLGTLVAQDIGADRYEIIVVDDAASAATGRQVRAWKQTFSSPTIRYLATSGHRGPASARNLGWHAASGSAIAFIDDDCMAQSAWLREGLRALEEADAVTGRVIVPLGPEPTDYERDAAGLENGEFVTANCFLRRSALEKIGGFDEMFTEAYREDSDLHFRLIEAGATIARAPEAKVIHPVRPAPWGVSLRQQRKSQFNALLYRKHPRLYRQRIQSLPPWIYYRSLALMVVGALATLRGRKTLAVAATALWLLSIAGFCVRRLEGTSKNPAHVTEMAVTSALIPLMSIYWRLRGAIRYRVIFL
jgi:GT2 family glycosyltransferase